MLTFPHMGNVYVSVKAFLDDIGADYIIPPFNSRRTLEKGVAAVPEGGCLPLKITVGALLEAAERGADTIIMASALGPCRFGYYCPMQKELLAEAGYPVRAIHFVPPRGDFAALWRNIEKIKGKANFPRFLFAAARAASLAHRVDALERLYFFVQPREAAGGQADALYKAFCKQALCTRGSAALHALVRETSASLRALPRDPRARPLRVGVVGEIYDNIDPFASLYLLEKLGRMGVEVSRPLSVSHWLDFVRTRLFRRDAHGSCTEAAKPYLNSAIGGHALETVGNSVLFARARYDGIIQIYPLGCMPEIVAQGILPAVSAREDIPVLTLVLDEQTGEAGLMTRVEAFLDLIGRRRDLRGRQTARNTTGERQNV